MVKQSYRRKRFAVVQRFLVLAIAVGGAALAGGRAEAQGLLTIEGVLQAHKAWPVAPSSVEMTGTSTKNGVTVPFRITGTRLEEALTEYGDQKRIASPKLNFQDDGKTVTFAKTPSGFGQLDVTGLFFIAQLQQRRVQLKPPQQSTVKGLPANLIRASSERSEMHYGRFRVNDEFDLYVYESGLLAGILRTYYLGDPIRYSLGYAFSDYRETEEILLPYRIEVLLKGRVIETLEVAQYRFNVSTPTSLFLPRRTR